jgi:hypothetical protein
LFPDNNKKRIYKTFFSNELRKNKKMGRKKKNPLLKIFNDCIIKKKESFLSNGSAIKKQNRRKKRTFFDWLMALN